MGIMLFKFSEYIVSVYHNGIFRSNSMPQKDAYWCFSYVVLRSRVCVCVCVCVCVWRNRDGPKPRPRNPTNVSSNAMYPSFNLNKMETKMQWNKRNLKLRNWHKLLLLRRGTCLHVSMKFTGRSVSFDLWIEKSAFWIVQVDIFGFFVREINPPITLAGRGLNTIALTAATLNFSLQSLACTEVY